ncbi:Alpha-amylase/pullulanase [Anaerohalosphaera lusitana]|uniref:Alpha-amylase/pullulanase n=1 Tax=Anaerohalosphaera lusitana TaxID=1936003 RepID=A0A1U9NGW0_9BACT|nr:cadherin-like domain-containing protein [Anaerohalosphaera lusitana]AQT67159.1 Alpha-amylase/pullulanase [Anaerohalosphaera lusitana]
MDMKQRKAGSMLIVCACLVLACVFLVDPAQAILPDNLTVNVGDVTGDGQSDNAVLTKRSLRAPGYRVWSYDGLNYTQVAVPEVRTYRGYIDSDTDVMVNAWVDENNLIDINLNEGRHHTARLTDLSVDLSGPDGTADPGTGNVEVTRSVDRVSPTASGYVIPKYTMSKLRVGVDICNDMYVAKGSSIAAAVGLCEQRINDTDYFYARDMGLAWEITEVVVRVGGDPPSWKDFWAGNDGITPYNFNTKLRFKAPGGGGSAGRVYSATVDFPNSHSATLGSTSPYSRSLGHEVAHGLGVGHYSDVNDTMSGSESALGVGTIQKCIEELHLASEVSAPEIIYGAELAPYAMWDAANTTQDQSVTVDLFENDYDGNGDSISLTYVDSVSDEGGTISVVSGGTVTYTPPASYLGVDRFRYHVSDSGGLTNRTGVAKIYVRNSDLATHLILDETDGMTAHDFGPYQADGILGGDTTPFSTGSQTGVIGYALENLVDSSKNAYVQVDVGDPLTDSLSASCWVKFNTAPLSDAAILSKGGAVIRGRVDNIRGGWAISVDDGKFYFACKLQTDSEYEGHLADLKATSNVQTGVWYHLAMTMDRQNNLLRAWINNSEVTNTIAGTTIPDGLIENYYPLTLFNCSRDDASLACVLDDVRIYNKVLTPSEVSSLYAASDEIPAGAPNPASGITEWLVGAEQSWMPGKPSDYPEFDVYLGTSESAVTNATTVSAEYIGRQTATTLTPSTSPGTTYYWRIDEVKADSTVIPGYVWNFSTTNQNLFSPVLINPSMEDEVVEPANSVNDIEGWYDGDSYTATLWEGDPEVPATPYGDNWAQLGNDKWAYQQIGYYAENQTLDVSGLIGNKANATYRGIYVDIYVGGDPLGAADNTMLSTIGAVQITTSGLIKPSIAELETSEFNVQLSTGIGYTVGAPMWLEIRQEGAAGKGLFDNIEIIDPDANQPPAFDSDPITKSDATEYQAYSSSIANDASDPENDTLTFSKVSGPLWLTVAGDGTLSGTPDYPDTGQNIWTVRVTDSEGGIDDAQLEINVINTNDAPNAIDDEVSTTQDTEVVIGVLVNDDDYDNDPLTIDSFTQGSDGTVTDNLDGTLTYTPDAGFYGTDSFTYTVTDGNGGYGTATVDVTVNEVVPFLHWAFDEGTGSTAGDSSGNGNDGSISGATWTTQGRDGDALVFDGVQNNVLLSLTESTWSEFSVAFWARTDTVSQDLYSGLFNNNSSGNDFQIDLSGGSPSSYRYSGTTMTTVSTEWIHLAVTFDGAGSRMFVNGSFIGTQPDLTNVFGQIQVGVNRNGQNGFAGVIDDVLVYEAALSDQAIADLYNSYPPLTDTTAPAAPTGLDATAGDGSVDLDWADNSEGDLASYTVYRSTTSGSGYSAIAQGVSNSNYTDNTVTNDTTYYYVVTAVDTSSNESNTSSEVSATPQSQTTEMYVNSIVMGSRNAGPNYWGQATVHIKDDTGANVSGATVYGTWSGAYSGSVSGTTAADGTLFFETADKVKNGGTFTFTVTDVTVSGKTYNATLNVETSDSITVP